MAVDNKMLEMALRFIPQSMIDRVPQLLTEAINRKLASIEHEDNEKPVIMISQSGDDCQIDIVVLGITGDVVSHPVRCSGREFVQSLLNELKNG